MKIRKQFVSNSSSTSYIIKVKKSEKCPHCGRSDMSFIDYIKNLRENYSDDTQYIGNKQYIIEYLKQQIVSY